MAEKKIIPISTEQFQEYFSVYNKSDEKDNSVIYSGITENLKNFAVGHYFWFVADCITMKTIDVSPNIEIHTPYNHKEWSNQNVQHFLDLIHPEDGQYLLSALVSSARIYKNMRRPEKNNIRFNFYVRMLNHENNYRWVLIQAPKQCFNKYNQIESSLIVIYDLSHFPINHMPLLSIIDDQGKEIQYSKHIMLKDTKQDDIKPNVTQREKEILMLMAQGLNSPKIAEHLFISYHTVENHKRNLRKKTNTKTSTELIAFSINNCILSV
ncbi:helix-turn-helix transcriptional regulator [Elizabethkingia miricola]|uniref:LuxR C-terminal-related transcriptional regulator n=1 Tax=Elizabethkingia miricola TaxID=172045 RepID=A0ABD5B7R3_ELIMR|nr:LuxR C-terminal-related transcriptional regulator [Elizabethkingia miricola]MDQ8749700.1 LuxR C-terminal-related transcriptional regulator [Elizabethkingia miricola]OPB90212.1 helix-turn-helix transcriptional regulator [Elizabethkingia miricola]